MLRARAGSPFRMSVKLRLNFATASKVVLAKVGNPQREEPLETSREVFSVAEDDQALLTTLLLKPFGSLPAHRFAHHSSLEQHEMNCCVKAVFADDTTFLENGIEIAQRLYAKSNHPNIKAGDLCITLVRDIEMEGQRVNGLCILKSDSVMPFLSISSRDGDLRLTTEEGINPDKIDKGCLILDFWSETGYYVQTFDRAGHDSRFWVREFLGVEPVPDSTFLTNAYTQMAVSFLEEQEPVEDAPPWDTCTAAHDALSYFDGRETFDLEDFQTEVLKSPEVVAKFTEHRARIEEEQGQPLQTSFEISKKDVTKAKKKLNSVIKLDSGVEIHIKPAYADHDPALERGYDERKKMNFVKIYYQKDVSGR
jgi:37-kD nucleoid-associated bacterial protein